MNNHLRICKPMILAGMLGLILFFGASSIVSALGAAECPRGSMPVEDIVSSKTKCQQLVSLNIEILDSGAEEARAPDRPEAPGKPAAPGVPEKPIRLPLEKSECEVSRWACEQSCQETYLSTATGVALDSAQRAKVVLGVCLQVCAEEYACPARAPKLQ